MSTLTLRKPRPEPVQADDIIPELAPQWDPKATYLNLRGIVGVEFAQGINYFNCRKEFVREIPLKERLKMPDPPKAPEVQHRGVRVTHMGTAPVVPEVVANAQKENARALAAESMAE